VKPEDENIAEINVAKQRNGPTGLVRLAFLKSETRFGNLAPNR
jgi:replicative DNA helicase